MMTYQQQCMLNTHINLKCGFELCSSGHEVPFPLSNCLIVWFLKCHAWESWSEFLESKKFQKDSDSSHLPLDKWNYIFNTSIVGEAGLDWAGN